MSLIIPEIVLLQAYKLALSFLRKNYKEHIADPTQSYLGLLLGSTNAVQRYKLLEQAKSVFYTTDDDPRALDVNLFFNAKRAAIPTIHITNPSENPLHDALALSEGFQDNLFDEPNQQYLKVFNRRFQAKYNIVLTSDNTNEIILLYQVIRSITIAMIDHLQLAGLENIKLSGNDISLKSDLVPNNIFIKAIGIQFEYDVPAIAISALDYSLGDFKPIIDEIIIK